MFNYWRLPWFAPTIGEALAEEEVPSEEITASSLEWYEWNLWTYLDISMIYHDIPRYHLDVSRYHNSMCDFSEVFVPEKNFEWLFQWIMVLVGFQWDVLTMFLTVWGLLFDVQKITHFHSKWSQTIDLGWSWVKHGKHVLNLRLLVLTSCCSLGLVNTWSVVCGFGNFCKLDPDDECTSLWCSLMRNRNGKSGH